MSIVKKYIYNKKIETLVMQYFNKTKVICQKHSNFQLGFEQALIFFYDLILMGIEIIFKMNGTKILSDLKKHSPDMEVYYDLQNHKEWIQHFKNFL